MLQARDAYDIRIAETFTKSVSSDVIVQATGLPEEEIKTL